MICVQCECDEDNACHTASGPCSWAFDVGPGVGVCTACRDEMHAAYLAATGQLEPARIARP